MKKMIIFDFDGTIVDSLTLVIDLLSSFSEKFGYKNINKRDIKKLRGKSYAYIIKKLEVSVWKIPLIISCIKKEYSKKVKSLKLFSGIKKFLLR